MTARKIVLIFALALLGIAALRDLGRLGDSLPWHRLYDFQDFYCAGAALDEHADPYRYEPLHRCEHVVNTSAAYRSDPSRAVPAPLPPYDFPPFMILARLSFPAARAIDAVTVALAIAAAIAGLSFVRVPLDVAALALVLPAGYLLLDAGQIVPFALLAVVFCGVAIAHRGFAPAGVLSALALIEPHLGLPVFLAVLILVPRARLAALTTAAILTIAAVVVAGTAGIAEYFIRVLPAQAAAETHYVYQYSLTYLLVSLGAPAAAALVLGQLSYFFMLLIGIRLGALLANALGRRELIAFLPAACSVIGGAYVHMVDLAVAIPAVLVLANALHGQRKLVASIAVCLLAVPWIAVWIGKKLFLASLFVVAVLLVRLDVAPAVAIATFSGIAAVIYLFELNPPAPFPLTAAVTTFAPNGLAEDAWRAYVASIKSAPIGWLLIKLPTWSALGAVLAVSRSAVSRRVTPPA